MAGAAEEEREEGGGAEEGGEEGEMISMAAAGSGDGERMGEEEGIGDCFSLVCFDCSCCFEFFVSLRFSFLPEVGEATLEPAAARGTERAEVGAGAEFREEATESEGEEETTAVVGEAATAEEGEEICATRLISRSFS